MADELIHYGTKRHSGRYPWGSGENPYQRDNKGFLQRVSELKKKGLSEKEIATALGLKKVNPKTGEVEGNIRELRAKISVAKKENIKENMQAVYDRRYKAKMSVKAIAEELGISESQVRNYLKPSAVDKLKEQNRVVDELKSEVDSKKYVDVSKGSNYALGVTQDKLEKTIAELKEEGYEVRNIKVRQVATGQYTTMKVLCAPGTTAREVYQNMEDIKPLGQYTIHDIDGTTKLGMLKPVSIDSSRIEINYADTGTGGEKDGVIEIRRGVDDLSLGNANYAQVRIAVDDTHYLKGMAVYSDDLPKGVDIRFNTNKNHDTPMLGTKDNSVLKELKKDPDNPFGATILQEKDLSLAQQFYVDKNGEKQQSAVNIVTEEGKWDTWSKTLASQFLSKQDPALAKKQLNLAVANAKSDLDDISKVTNPVLKKKLLEEFANGADADAAHLKAAALPRQSSKVILPVPSLKDNEIYAPGYRDGESVVLIRYPHGGVFEIPELKVNNSNKEAKKTLGTTPTDAVGINAHVASRLSGADFDGDTVVVIPVKNAAGVKTVAIKTSDPLEGLKNFDPKDYKLPDDAPKVDTRTKNQQMGIVSNLITDMTLKGAGLDEIERAVKHSMVVIDSEKHHLDYKKSAVDNNIDELHLKWQGKKNGGASTIVSKAESQAHAETVKDYYKIDPNTGEKITTLTGDKHLKPSISYKKMNDAQKEAYKKVDSEYRKTGKVPDGKVEGVSYKEVATTYKTTKMATTKDARTLMSENPAPMEVIYADYANAQKALANEARKMSLIVTSSKASPSAAKTYAKEVESLNQKLIAAQRNAPRERMAQIYANSRVSAQLDANPDLKYDEDKLKKVKNQALSAGRNRFGADKKAVQIHLTQNEIKAIQSNAISSTKQKEIFDNCDSDELKRIFTPKSSNTLLSNAKISQIKAMKASGYTMTDIADKLGVSTSTVSKAINGTL